MRCGGHCAYCRGWFDHNRATELGTRVLAQLDPKITSYAKHPADDERARASRVPPPDPAAHTRTSASLGPLTPSGESSSSRSLASSRRSITPNKQPKGGTTGERTTPTSVPSSASGGAPPPPPQDPTPDRSPRGPPRGPPRRTGSGSGGDEGGSGGGGTPSRPSHVPGRTADLEWRDRAIRAEAVLDRLQAENQELRERMMHSKP